MRIGGNLFRNQNILRQVISPIRERVGYYMLGSV